jgi:hypothetical protein
MKRIFPTALQVRNNRDEVSEDEKKKGYFDESSRDSDLIIGVCRNKIHLCCPQYWYRTFTFILDPTQLPEVEQIHEVEQQQPPQIHLEEGEISDVPPTSGSHPIAGVPKGQLCPFSIISLVIKTECGRSALCELPENFIRISHLSRKQAKQIYYLFKHVLDREHVTYRLKSSWRSFDSAKWETPDIRIKAKRRRKKEGKGGQVPL